VAEWFLARPPEALSAAAAFLAARCRLAANRPGKVIFSRKWTPRKCLQIVDDIIFYLKSWSILGLLPYSGTEFMEILFSHTTIVLAALATNRHRESDLLVPRDPDLNISAKYANAELN
jgi:hypothetical protein